MIGFLQRVKQADVQVDGRQIAKIDQGLLVLVGVEKTDMEEDANRLLERLLNYRVFADAHDRMNLSLRDIEGGLLLVPQFTLVADTSKGNRPGFSKAATPEQAERLFDHLLTSARQTFTNVTAGQFAADMQVSLINDGPVSFWLETKKR